MSLGKLLSEKKKKTRRLEVGMGRMTKKDTGSQSWRKFNSSGTKFRDRILQEAISERGVPSRIREMVCPIVRGGIFQARLVSLAVSSGLWKYLQLTRQGKP